MRQFQVASPSRSQRMACLLLSAAALFLTGARGHGLPADSLELRGRVEFPNGAKPSGRVSAVVFLEGTAFPYSRSSLAGPDGKFKFKELRPATYRLTIYVPNGGTMEQTVEVTPSFTDRKGRIERVFSFRPRGDRSESVTVPVTRLKVPDKALKKYQEAEEALGKHRVEEAIKRLEEAVEIAPEYGPAWNRLGTIAFQSRRYAEAEGHFRKSLGVEPDAYAPLVNLGGALLVLGRLREALEVNEKATRQRPEDPLAHSQLGQTLFALGDFAGAEQHLLRAIALDPNHFSFPRLTLAEIYRLQLNYPAVVSKLEEFLAAHPDVEFAEKIRTVIERARKEVNPATIE